MNDDVLKTIRDIRSKQNIKLKPSPYLKKSYTDEYGEEKDIQIRNYQAQMIMNLLSIERMINAEDTGLGKTIELLTAIGYIWLKEPQYVPIIVTTKSSLHQWEAETRKFMHDMDVITVSGEPFERHKLYEEFFWRHDPNKKRLIILTYDMMMKDMSTTVIRDRSQKPPVQAKKDLAVARKIKKAATEGFEIAQKEYDVYFSERIIDIFEHARSLIHAREFGNDIKAAPGVWTPEDQKQFEKYWSARSALKEIENKVVGLTNEVAPPKQVPSILEYLLALRDDYPESQFMLIFDEMHKLKNHKSQFHEKAKLLSMECRRIYGMTATPVKNRLMEFFSLFRIIKPELFPKITHFQNEFCVMKMQRIGGERQVPIVVGYRNLDKFVERIEPYYLSRKKHEVAKELPELISREVECELTELQEELYDMAEAGLLNKSDDPDASNAEMLSSLTMCQQAVDSPQLIANEDGDPFEGPSCKIDELLELLNNDALDQKVIVFSKFERMISLVERSLKDSKINCVRITGKESDSKIRNRNKDTFQDMNSGVNVVLITTAGSESMNLHSAEHISLLDLPWSYGDYLQLIGRAIRIGSLHKTVIAHHFLGKKRSGKNTIDHHVLKALRTKKKLADKVAGNSLVGGLNFVGGDVSGDIISMIKGDRQINHVTNKLQVVKKIDEPKINLVELDLSDI